MLHDDQRSRRIVGSRYLVSAEAFVDRVREVCRQGRTIPDSLEQLRDERTWSRADAGVEPLFTADAIIEEAAGILRTAQRSAHQRF